MTEPKTEIQSADNKAAAANKVASGATRPAHPAPANRARRRPTLVIAFIVVLLIAIALGAGLWYQQKLFVQARTQFSTQVQNSLASAQQAASSAQRALVLVHEQKSRIDTLQSSLDDTHDQVAGLDQAFQLLTDKDSDLLLINDVDHLVQIAHQQLALGSNVSNAIVALEAAQAQLARANRPSLASLQQAINGDLDRLRAVSVVDVAQLSARLDKLGELVSTAPLLVPDDAAPGVDTSARNATGQQEPGVVSSSPNGAFSWNLDAVTQWAKQGWATVRHEMASLISVRRVQDSSALLMSQDQAAQLRENLRLRVLTAQLALMMHQPTVWDSEMKTLIQVLNTHYDTTAAPTREAQKLASQLAATAIVVKLPTVSNSVQALDALREASEKVQQPQVLKQENSAKQAVPEAASHQPSDAAPAQPGDSQPDLQQE
jgi:uroporphyrin-3 C-methyltransferase